MQDIENSEIIEDSYQYTINYWKYATQTVGECIYSPVFDICDSNWQLRISPNGSSENHKDNVSFYLTHRGNKTVTAKYVLSAFGCTFTSSGAREFDAFNIHANTDADGWGRDKFISNTHPKTNTDNVTFKVTITRMTETKTKTRQLLETPNTVMKRSLSLLWEEKSCTDIVIKIGDVKFDVHKCILTVWSNFFKAMLTNSEFQDSQTNTIVLDDTVVDANTFEEILKFIYTGSFSSNTVINDNMAMLLFITKTYEFNCLDEMLEDYIVNNSEFSTDDYLSQQTLEIITKPEPPKCEQSKGLQIWSLFQSCYTDDAQ